MKKKFLLAITLSILLAGCLGNHELYSKKPAFYSYIFGYINSNKIKTEHASNVYITPASCQKIITALLAYKKLGANFQYQTTLSVTKNRNQINNVVISFSGDPFLTSQDLSQLLAVIRNKKVNGQLFLDISSFKTPQHSPNILIRDVGTTYAAPISAMNIDKNLISVTIKAGKLGREAVIKNNGGFKVIGKITTTNEDSAIKIGWHDNKITVDGHVKFESKDYEAKISPPEVNDYALYKIKETLKGERISIKKISIVTNREELPKNLELLNIIKSESLKTMLPKALKQSDNLVFDSLYLKLVQLESPKITEWNDGGEIIKSLVKEQFDIDLQESIIVDGSGLSRYNKIQTGMLFNLLKKGYQLSDFTSSFASVGEADSTLVKRTSLSNNIIAKTGNMLGVSCLCGYKIDDLNPQAFVITVREFSSLNSAFFPILDDFVNKNLE